MTSGEEYDPLRRVTTEADTTTVAEYDQAYAALRTLTESDPAAITSFTDLSAALLPAAAQLQTILRAQGYVADYRYYTLHAEDLTTDSDTARDVLTTVVSDHSGGTQTAGLNLQEWRLEKDRGDHRVVLIPAVGKGSLLLSVYKLDRSAGYDIDLPLPAHLRQESPFSRDATLAATRWVNGSTTEAYLPGQSPNTPADQQSFMRLTQDGIREVLEVVNDPGSEVNWNLDDVNLDTG